MKFVCDPQWISVKERLPDINKRVLIFVAMYNTDGSDFISASYLTLDNKWFLTSGFCCSHDQYFGTNQVTHWMTLPKPPKEFKKEKNFFHEEVTEYSVGIQTEEWE